MKGLFMVCFKKILLVSFLIMVNALVTHAQPGDPGGDPDVPISGIELLIGAGGLYGVRKLMKKRNPSDN